MVILPPAFLSAVRVSAPAEIRLRSAAAGPPAALSSAAETQSDAVAAADRLARYATAGAGRSSRSEAQLRTFTRANDEATTTTTEAPTTTTAAPTTTTAKPKPTTTTARPKAAAVTTTTSKPTTTTAKPAAMTTTSAAPSSATTSTMGPPPPCCRQEGGASYHDYSDPRTCAHRSLPKGTALRVTNLANGQRTTCVVNDRGPYVEGRIIDLSTAAFGEIANVSDGVIRVAIEW